jgi:hypothetical protein
MCVNPQGWRLGCEIVLGMRQRVFAKGPMMAIPMKSCVQGVCLLAPMYLSLNDQQVMREIWERLSSNDQ